MEKNDTQKEKTKLILYKKVNEKKNLFYFCNEDNEQNNGKPLKQGNTSIKNSNNLLINNMKNNNNKINNNQNNNKNNTNNNKTNNINNKNQNQNDNTNNNEISKKSSMINYVSKDDKSKNLFVFKAENNTSSFNILNQNKGKDSKYNRYNEKRKEEKTQERVNTFNIQKLKKKNANEVKILNDKQYELPISNICYFKKFNIYIETKFKLPISNRCYFNKSIIFTEEKLKLPISNICYLYKSNIIKEEKIRHTIITNYYFCTKENKINDKKGKSLIVENCIGFDCLRTIKIRKKYFGYNLLKNAKTKNQNENDNVIKIFKYQPKPKKEDKKNDAKFKEYKKKLNDRLRNYKTIKHEDIMQKLNSKENNSKPIKYVNIIKLNRENNSERKNKNIKKSISIKDSSNKYSGSLSNKNIKKYVISKTENENNSSISFNDSNNNNLGKYSFYNLFDKNNKNIRNKNKNNNNNNNKIILQRFMENGQIKNNRNNINEKEKKIEKNNNNVIIPNIFDNINKKTPKSKTFITTQSSRYLIKKINSTNLKNRNNNNSLFTITKNPNNLFSMDTNTIDNHHNCIIKYQIKNNNNNDLPSLINNKNSEEINQCHHAKYDKHFGNENNCPKCQSMDMKINYIKDKKNQVIPNINPLQQNNNSFNKTFDNFKRNNFIIPLKYFEKLYLKNYNNYRNNSKNILSKLQRNNSVIQIKKLKIKKYSKDMLTNYKSSLLAIKEYFKIK